MYRSLLIHRLWSLLGFEDVWEPIRLSGQSGLNAFSFSPIERRGRVEFLQWMEAIAIEMVQLHFSQSLVDLVKNLTVSRSTSKRPCRERKWGETITLEMVQQHFGQRLVDAARSLEVSKSTLKRHCRRLGITSWPSKMMTSEGPVPIGESVQIAGSFITNASRLPNTTVVSDQLNSEFHVEKSRPACYQQQNFLLPSAAPDPSTDQFIPGMPRVVTSRQDTLSSAMTTVKAAYEGDNIKFQIDLTAGGITDQLKDGVAKRLQLQDGSYEMMYKDDDDDWILIKCDEDVHECIRNSNLPGSKAVKLYLRGKKL